jgi:hypothetical protein
LTLTPPSLEHTATVNLDSPPSEHIATVVLVLDLDLPWYQALTCL